MAIAIPPKLIVFISKPKASSTKTVPNKESGIANNEIIVVLKLPKNKKRMITTKNAPSSKAFATLFTEV